jgi:hypothetical protein
MDSGPVSQPVQKKTGGRRNSEPPATRKKIHLFHFKLSSVMSKASLATTVDPHQLEFKPAGL